VSRDGKKTGGKDFKKGWKGGPGAPPSPPEINKLATLTKKEALALLGSMLQKPMEEVQAILVNPKLRAFDHVTAAIVLKSVDGNAAYLKEMLDRLYGKVKEDIQVSVRPKIIHNLDGGSVELLMEGKEDE
jgi:hypothetical protein